MLLCMRCRVRNVQRGAIWIAAFALLSPLSPLRARATEVSVQPSRFFEFHSGFWINLHHFLYMEALATASQTGRRIPVSVSTSDSVELKNLSAEDNVVWSASLEYYRHSMINRDLLFDRGMEEIKNKLEDSESSLETGSIAIPDDLRLVLHKAAPIYRRHWWPKHEALNRQWIAALNTLIQEHGDSLYKALTTIYEEPWPGNPVRVDAVAYANWAGAYTSLEPTRVTVSTTDPSNQGPAALEVIFHETSHGMMNKVIGALDDAEKTLNSKRKNNPIEFRRDLWHEVLFYTSGELVRQRVPGYVPYADQNGLWKRAWTGSDRALIERDWKPHMNGSDELQQSLTKLVEELAAPDSNAHSENNSPGDH